VIQTSEVSVNLGGPREARIDVLTIDPYLLLLLIACLFVLVFGGLSYIRREGLSSQFALESVALTVLFVGGSWLLGLHLSPYLFLILLYLVTMRSRLIVDLANLFATRDRYAPAFRLYQLGLTWWPDPASRLIVLTNRGVAELRSGQVDTAVDTLQSVLSVEERPRLGLKYEAACRYNLGLAYEQTGEDGKAATQFNEVIDLLPGSPYAQAARAGLKRRRTKSSGD
jgi:tetratricopeptide (TPR) repeat protein